MKLAVSRDMVTYWNEIRGLDPAPTRAALKPGSISNLLPDLFILQRDRSGLPLFRLAGTRVCTLVGRELRQQSFRALFPVDQQQKLRMLIHGVADRLRPALLTLAAIREEPARLDFEMVLLPVLEEGRDSRLVLGVIAPLGLNARQILSPVRMFSIDNLEPIRTEFAQGAAESMTETDWSMLAVLKRLSGLGNKNRSKPVA